MNKMISCKIFIKNGELYPKIYLNGSNENGPKSFIQKWSYRFGSLLFKTELEYIVNREIINTVYETRVHIIRFEKPELKTKAHIKGLFKIIDLMVFDSMSNQLNVSYKIDDYDFYETKYIDALELVEYNFPNHPLSPQGMQKIHYLPIS